ncbi:MAG: hypothetical protein RL477_1213 [Pseudomonadota bacterium]|jgi:nucleoside-diphosphate-sugar epimerase
MKVFVTGASGYAGFYAALRLAACGHQVTGIVRNPAQPRLDVLRMQEVRLVVGDVSDTASYRDELAAADVVIHTMLDKKNLLGTDRALFAALDALPRRGTRRRFVYTTGCSIFGKIGVPVMDESVEPHPDHPLAFRRTLEKEALALANVATTVLRPGFMYGNDGYNSVSTDWFAMAAADDVVYRGDRDKGWSWVHIADLAEAYRRVAEAPEKAVAGEVFHLADDERPRCIDVMRACLAAAGYTGEIRFEGSKKGDNISTWFDQNEFITSAKARARLGWRPRHDGIVAGARAAFEAWKAGQSGAVNSL